MAIRALRTKDQDEVVEVGQTADGNPVLEVPKDYNFPNLETAINALRETIAQDESNKLRMARIVRAIEAQKLYEQIPGCTSFKAFLPMLLERTASVGWKSGTTIKRYLALVKLYLEQLDYDAELVIRTVSHLFELNRLARLSRKTGEMEEESDLGKGKLGKIPFEDISRLVMFMVTGFSREQMVSGLDEDATAAVLADAGMSTQAATYRELMGEDIKMPTKGWSVADTERIVKHLTGETDDEGDEDEDLAEEVHRVWVGFETFGGAVHIERIEFRRGEVKLNEIEVNKSFTNAEFELLRGKDAKQIAGEGGEQNADDEAE